MLKCFFFDRDGVLIKDYGYVHKINHLKWLKGARKAIKFLNEKKIKVVVITNQSGVARGYYKVNDVEKFHKWMNKILIKNKAKIDNFFYCPYHPKALIKKYKKKSNMRKPGNGMLLKAMKQYKLSPKECFMIGNETKDSLASVKTNILFEYKKNYSLDIQVKKILNKINLY